MENLTIHRSLLEKFEVLNQRIEDFKKERNEAVILIRKLMEVLDINVADLNLAVKKPVAPKYRNPETGAVWSGRGVAPLWIRGHTNLDAFLIKP